MYQALDKSGEAVTLHISKAFGRAWHIGSFHKLKFNGISEGIFEPIHTFLSNCEIKVVVNGHSSRVF